ncbi:YcnI family copper-binding membrane protein [Luethyella okanaganae]|uniref:YcnI family protein n=1 Tax=Luethyella okanaganae TaxID=69372 RepID=A0ABW1VIT1_9MICO
MTTRTPLRRTTLAASAIGAGLLLAVAAPLSASAHVGVTSENTAAGSHTVLTFAVPHGCDGSSTTKIAIDIPESIVSVTPTVNPGWEVEKVSVPLPKPVTDSMGNSVTDRIGRIVYTAKTPLPDGLRDTFALAMTLPQDAAGKTLAFPVLQSCEQGVTSWDQLAAEGEPEPAHPAPSIAVTAAVAGNGHGGAHGGAHGAAASAAGGGAGASAGDDVLARVLGVGGLVVGAVGLVLAVAARGRAAK